MKRYLISIGVAIAISGSTTLTFAQEGSGEATPVPETHRLTPEMTFRVKDGKALAQLASKNKWFAEFRQSGLYQGALFRLSDVLFSPADEHGNAAAAWKGRLLDSLYETLLQNKPVALFSFRGAHLSSPYVVSVQSLGRSEITAAETLMKVLKSADLSEVTVETGRVVKVTPLLVKGQKFAAVLESGCLSVGRSPEAVAAASVECPRLTTIAKDAELKIDLNRAFPALSTIRDQFLGVKQDAKIDFVWKAAESRFAVSRSEIPLSGANHLLFKDKMPADLLKTLPSGTVFFTSGFVPQPKAYDPVSMTDYFKEDKATLKKGKSRAVVLAYLGIDQTDKDPSQALPAVLIHHPNAGTAQVAELSKTFAGRGYRTVYSRKVCANVIAISPNANALDLLEKTCKKEVAAFTQLPERFVNPISTGSISSAAYLNPGRLLSTYIENGWRSQKKKAELPPELKSSRALIEQLPSYVFVGQADDKRLAMKAIE